MPRLSRWTRRRAALLALPVLLLAIPIVGARASGPIENCRKAGAAGLHWQRVNLPITNPTGFAVDYTQPNRLLVSSATQIYFSDDHGCSWVNAVSLTTLAEDAGYSSAISRIVDVAFNLSGAAIATISEGVGSQARPHVIRSKNGAKGTWQTSDDGLPAVGEPRTLAAGIIGFVIGLAQFGSDITGGGGLPGGIGGGTDPTGQVPAMVYRSADGSKWAAGATTADFGGARVVSLIAADRFSTSEVYAVADGHLYYSHDNGATFHRSPLSGTPTALATTFRSEVVAFGTGFAARSRNGGVSFSPIRTVPGARAAAWRTDGNYMVANPTTVYRTNGSTLEDVTPDKYVTGTPTLRSTFIGEDTWYLAVGNKLYRWFDKYKPAKQPPGIPNQRVTYTPKPGTITPARPVINLRTNGSRTVRYRISLPKNATPLDVYYLIDVSASMGTLINDLKQNAKEIGRTLKAQGIDINEGIAAVGTAPNTDIGVAPDPPTDPTPRCTSPNNPPGCHDGPYHQPVLYKRWAPVGKVDQSFFEAVNRLEEEYYLQPAPGCQDGSHPGRNGCDQHLEGQLLSYVQAITGSGVSDPRLNVPVLPGQDAGFRQAEGTRRIIIMGTDARFSAPVGSPMRNGDLDFATVGALLKEHGVLALGLSLGSVPPLGSRDDLETLARATGALAPAGGVPCQYGDTAKRIPAGRPIVCDDAQHFSETIAKLLASLADFQNVQLEPTRVSPVLRGVSVLGFNHVNVKAPFAAEFTATYSCVGVPTGTYTVGLGATLRGFQVAQTVATVSCGAALVPPVTRPDPIPLAQNPPGNPAPPPPAPLPAQPVTQVQSQAQPQVQVNPQVGAAAQQEEQLQLALAQAGLFTVDDDEKVTQQAMSRRDEERAAVAALAAALLASSVVGLAMMRRHRTQQAVRVTPAWARRR